MPRVEGHVSGSAEFALLLCGLWTRVSDEGVEAMAASLGTIGTRYVVCSLCACRLALNLLQVRRVRPCGVCLCMCLYLCLRLGLCLCPCSRSACEWERRACVYGGMLLPAPVYGKVSAGFPLMATVHCSVPRVEPRLSVLVASLRRRYLYGKPPDSLTTCAPTSVSFLRPCALHVLLVSSRLITSAPPLLCSAHA